MAWESLNFTTRSLVQLTPKDKEFWVKDEGGKLSVNGLCLRVYPTGAKRFYLIKRLGRKTIKHPLGKLDDITHVQARELAERELARIVLTGVSPTQEKRARRAEQITLQQAFDDFIKDRGIKPNTHRSYETALRLHLKHWQNQPLQNISDEAVLRHYKKLVAVSPTAANVAMRTLRAVFNYADGLYKDENGKKIRHDNPVAYLSKKRAWAKETPRENRILEHQLQPWYNALATLESTPRDYLQLVLFTGLRRREAAALRWQDIDWHDKTLTIVDTKNHDALTIPLSSHVLTLLEERYNARSLADWVFPSNSKSGHIEEPKKALAKVNQQAGTTVSCHDLRRTFISIGESLDIAPYSLKRLVNHRTRSDVTESHYLVIEIERLRRSTQRISDEILRMAGKTSSGQVIDMNPQLPRQLIRGTS